MIFEDLKPVTINTPDGDKLYYPAEKVDEIIKTMNHALFLTRASNADAWSRVWMHRLEYKDNFKWADKFNKVEDICHKKAETYK